MLSKATLGRLLSLSLLLTVNFAEGLRHSYKTRDDERSLIGPLGFPFGFLDTGRFNLTVFDFELSVGVHPEGEEHDQSHAGNTHQHSRSLSGLDEIDGVGFVLKKFKEEAEFNHYMNWLEADPTRCAFQSYLKGPDEEDDLVWKDDDDDERFSDMDGQGEVLDVNKDGIFLILNMVKKDCTF